MTAANIVEAPSAAAVVAGDVPPPSVRTWKASTLVIVGYLALGLYAFWPVLPWTSDKLFGTGADSILAMWFLAWVPHALAHGINPLFSQAIFAPHGVNLAQNTEAPFLGLLTTPLALFMGPIARANLLMVLAMPVSATAAYIVLRKWMVWWPAAAIGGLMYGFAPTAIGQGLGHLVLVFLPLPPFIALTLASILMRRGSPLRLGPTLGILVAAQFLCEAEIMVTVTLISAWAVLWVAIRYRSHLADVARPVITSFLIAGGTAAALLAYPIWLMLAGPQHYTGTAQPTDNPYYNDVVNFVAPGVLQRFSFGIHFAGVPGTNPSEAGGYIGIPILIIALMFAWRSRRSPRMQLTLIVLAGAAILTLGPHLSVDGHLTRFPLPFLVIQHLPLIDNVLPARISMEVAACVGAIIAFGLDDVRRDLARGHRHRPSGKGLLVALPLVVLAVVLVTQAPVWPYAWQPTQSLPAKVSNAIPTGDPVTVTYPVASPLYPLPMSWQAQSGFRFRLVGGYAEHPDPNGHPTGMPDGLTPPGMDLFLDGQEAYNQYLPPVPVTPALIVTLRGVAAQNDVRFVIVDRSVRGSTAVVDAFSQAFGAPQVTTSRYVLWSSPGRPL